MQQGVCVDEGVHCAACCADNDKRFACAFEQFQQFALAFGQHKVGFVARGILVARVALFALDSRVKTHAGDDDIGVFRSGERLGISVAHKANLRDSVLIEMTALGEDDAPCEPVLNAFQQSDVSVGFRRIVALKGDSAVRLGTDNCDSIQLFLVKRQDAVVFQQDYAFLRRFERFGFMLLAGNDGIREIIRRLLVEHAEPYACAHCVDAGGANLFLGDKTLVVGGHKVLVGAAAVDVAAHFYCERRGFFRLFCEVVRLVEIANRPAVRHEITVKAPVFELVHQIRAGAGRLAVDCVVCAHHALDLCVFDKALKGGQVGFVQILFADRRVEAVTCFLGSAVGGKVLCTGCREKSFAVALNALDILHAKLGGEVWVFAVSLLSASPARVTKDIYVGRPYCNALELVCVARFFVPFVLCASLCARYLSRAAQKRPVPRCRKTDCLREKRGDARTGKPVQTLVPPVVRGYAEALYRLAVVFELTCHLLNSHLVNKCLSARLRRKCFVKVFFHKYSSFSNCYTNYTTKTRRMQPFTEFLYAI